MQESKYMVANERDARWGLTVSTVGYDEVLAEVLLNLAEAACGAGQMGEAVDILKRG